MYIDESLEVLRRSVIEDDAQHVLIAYHANCMDGLTAALVMGKACEAVGLPAECITYLPVEYTPESVAKLVERVNDYPYEFVYILDFSVCSSVLAEIAVNCAQVFLLDHHKTAFERYFPEEEIKPDSVCEYISEGVYIKLDNGQSGAGLTLSEVSEPVKLPDAIHKLVSYVQDRDLWKHELPHTKEINAWLSNAVDIAIGILRDTKTGKVKPAVVLSSFEFLANDLYIDEAHVVKDGAEILADKAQQIANLCKACRLYAVVHTNTGFYSLPYVELPDTQAKLTSEVGHLLAKDYTTCGIGIVVIKDNEAGNYKVSLRSIGEVDVSATAKMYGGGGHKNAAGYTAAVWPPKELPNVD